MQLHWSFGQWLPIKIAYKIAAKIAPVKGPTIGTQKK